ncbi:AAA family ATPase [Pararhizobium sp. BT-229]|uniref:AAA family ATPase n=1 Tax=Pararhizobium sp. BT-229 TaxID=2986923 RepID=UPI0021F6CBA3|nr:AAA family ATPase [Pararhizobium sp. BT-229]MCV9961962.1 AAA family ATPase [Pararhizobium sp. BT-229]
MPHSALPERSTGSIGLVVPSVPMVTDMEHKLNDARFRKMCRSPNLFLCYCGMRKALRTLPAYFQPGRDGFVVFIVPPGYRSVDYYQAAKFLIDESSDFEWGDGQSRIRTTEPPNRGSKPASSITVHDIHELAILIAADVTEISAEIKFAALDVLHVSRPSPRQIQAARRLARRAPFSDEMAAALASKSQGVVIAAISRASVDKDRLDALARAARPGSDGPDLFELPGYQHLKEWTRRVLADLSGWRAGRIEWNDARTGALIYGPPGTGKTYFAEAFANALGMRLVSATMGEWQARGHLGDMLKAMRESFSQAGEAGGAVLFVDEMDSIGSRTGSYGGSNDHYWQVAVNEFLALLNRLPDGVIVLGATNFPELIDPAIVRSGRLERRFELALPDSGTRAQILNFHTGNTLCFKSLVEIADNLTGRSGAYLEEMVREARRAAREEDREIAIRDLAAQLPDLEPFSPEDLFRMSVHESGHALVALSVGYAFRATITVSEGFDPNSASRPGGMTEYESIETALPTETTMLDRIAVALGGMAAEHVICGSRSVGSGGVVGSDLERATSIARRLVGSYGLGRIPIFVGPADSLGSGSLPDHLERNVMDILEAQYERARALLGAECERVKELARDAMLHRRVTIARGE